MTRILGAVLLIVFALLLLSFCPNYVYGQSVMPEVLELAQKTQQEFESEEMRWLALNIYFESRGEDPYGMLLVGLVTLDRVNKGKWGNTIEEVVTAPHQFSWYSDGKSDIPKNKKAWKKSKRIAFFANMIYSLMGDRIDLTYYHSKDVNPVWAKNLEMALTEGNHIFYREKG